MKSNFSHLRTSGSILLFVLFVCTPVLATQVTLDSNKPLWIINPQQTLKASLVSNGIINSEASEWLVADVQLVVPGNWLNEQTSLEMQQQQINQLQELAKDKGANLLLLRGQVVQNKLTNGLTNEWLNTMPQLAIWADQAVTHRGLSLTAVKTDFIIPEKGKSGWDPDIHMPVNYLGNQICHPLFETNRLKDALDKIAAKTLWVTNAQPELTAGWMTRLAGQLQVIADGVLVKLTSTSAPVVSLGGVPLSAVQAPNRFPDNPVGLSEQEILEILTKGEVVGSQAIPVGITKSMRLTLKYHDTEIDAIFKIVDSAPNLHRGRWETPLVVVDRYGYEVAAYKLDRMLNLGLIPAAIVRTIDDQDGVLQVWYDGLISKLSSRDKGMKYKGHCDRKSQRRMMHVFDYLIHNEDRNQSNILYNKSDWQIWFIDHSRSFGVPTRRHKNQKKSKFYVTPEFRQALESLSREQLNELKPWLHNRQIRSLDKRRRNLIEGDF